MKRKNDDALVTLVVASAAVVLGLVLWAGGKRLYARWQVSRAPAPVTAPVSQPSGDAYDRPPAGLPPLAMVGIAPTSKPIKPRDNAPAALPMPPITPDRE